MRHGPTEDDIVAYFDSRVDCCAPGSCGPTPRAGRVSMQVRELLADRVADRSILEVGCGTGDLLRFLVQRGARTVTGVDVSPAAIAEAIGRARAAGLADRMRFVAANAAVSSWEAHDIVVLDKVICCYPDWSGLLAATAPAARSAYVFAIPRTDGPWRALTPVAIGIENLMHRLRGRRFRAFAHDNGRIGQAVEAAGFRLVHRRHALAWLAAVYQRPLEPPAENESSTKAPPTE